SARSATPTGARAPSRGAAGRRALLGWEAEMPPGIGYLDPNAQLILQGIGGIADGYEKYLERQRKEELLNAPVHPDVLRLLQMAGTSPATQQETELRAQQGVQDRSVASV